jgi:hypothetical protein
VAAEALGVEGGDAVHGDLVAGEAEDGAGEVELALDRPEVVVAVGWEQLSWIASPTVTSPQSTAFGAT